tara:strand:- start:9361 stop:10035 length:675 start_codon:yes stop_codon:yes gene_type:complete
MKNYLLVSPNRAGGTMFFHKYEKDNGLEHKEINEPFHGSERSGNPKWKKYQDETKLIVNDLLNNQPFRVKLAPDSYFEFMSKEDFFILTEPEITTVHAVLRPNLKEWFLSYVVAHEFDYWRRRRNGPTPPKLEPKNVVRLSIIRDFIYMVKEYAVFLDMYEARIQDYLIYKEQNDKKNYLVKQHQPGEKEKLIINSGHLLETFEKVANGYGLDINNTDLRRWYD